MKRAIVLGTGMIGNTVVAQLAKSRLFDEVVAVDASEERLNRCLEAVNHPNVSGKTANLKDLQTMTDVLKEADLAVNCLPHTFSLKVTKAAISAKCHLVDLVENYYLEKLELQEEAREAGVLVLAGCGVAPGLVNVLASRGIDLMDEADEAVLICGGIPRHPVPPLWYQLVFNMEGLLGLYQSPALAVENGEVVHIPPLSGREELTFPEPVGQCEAVITDASTTPYTLHRKVKRLYEKTIRYKGHWDKIQTLAELGFLSDKPIEVDGMMISPQQFSGAVLGPHMKGESEEDLTVLRVTVSGKKDGQNKKVQWDMIDSYDTERKLTSMARTTAFPASILAEWIATGRFQERGIWTLEEIIKDDRFTAFLSALASEGISLSYQENCDGGAGVEKEYEIN